MSKLTLTDLTNLNNPTTAVAAINANNAAIEDIIENTVSRNGAAPNQMQANFDMNSNRILNLPAPQAPNDPVRLQDLQDALFGNGNVPAPLVGQLNYVLRVTDDVNGVWGWAPLGELVLGDGDVTTDKIADGNITSIKLSDGAVTTVKLANGAVTTAKLADNSVTNAKMADDSVGIAELSATGTPSATTYLRGDNTWAEIQNGVAIQGQHKNLKIANNSGSPNSVIDVTFDSLITTNGTLFLAPTAAQTLTASTAVSGLGGIDTGSVANSTWYSVWVISNGTLWNTLLSTSDTSPTMPVGYTYKARVGWVRTDGSANLYRTMQKGRKAHYVVSTGSNTAALPLFTSTSVGNTNTPTWVSQSVANFVPTTASEISLVLQTYGFGYFTNYHAIAAPNNSYGNISSTNPPPLMASTAYAGAVSNIKGSITLESTNVYVATDPSARIFCYGWEDDI